MLRYTTSINLRILATLRILGHAPRPCGFLHLARPPLQANAFAENLSVRFDDGDLAGLVGQSILKKTSNGFIALNNCRKRRAAAFANSGTGAHGHGHAADPRRDRRSGRGSFTGIRRPGSPEGRSRPVVRRRKPEKIADHRQIRRPLKTSPRPVALCASALREGWQMP